MTTIDTKAIRERADAASQGPWTEGIDGNPRVYAKDNCPDAGCIASFMRRKDIHFVAHARTDVPALCDEVDRLRAELAAKDALLAEARGLISDQIESESEFQTEWDQSARAFLTKLKEQE